jgi:hypothetical protein
LSAIEQLFLSGRPTAIAGFVASIVVDALKGQSKWSIPHIGVEIYKDQPTFTDCDASSSIILKGGEIGEEAPVLHSQPTGVGARALASSVLAVTKPLIILSYDAPVFAHASVYSKDLVG